jgi:hypothetical protein
MKNNCREIQLTDYIDATEPELNYPLQIIGNIPFNAIQNIKTTLNFINATPAQMWLLKEIDFFWYRMMYWISYYRIGNLDRRLKPLSTKEFRNVEIFGELYAAQLDLTINFNKVTGILPKEFPDPLSWWTYQILEIKNDWYFSVFNPSNDNKTESLSNMNKCLQVMKGKSTNLQSFEKTMSASTEYLLINSQKLAYGATQKHKDFKLIFLRYVKIFQKYIYLIKGSRTKKGFHLAIAKGDFIYLSNQNSRRKMVIQ